MWVARRRSSARRICWATGWLWRTRRLRHLLARRGVLRPHSWCRSSSGAPSSSALRVLTAEVRAVVACVRAVSRIRMASRGPSRRGWASRGADRATRAALAASAGSDCRPGGCWPASAARPRSPDLRRPGPGAGQTASTLRAVRDGRLAATRPPPESRLCWSRRDAGRRFVTRREPDNSRAVYPALGAVGAIRQSATDVASAVGERPIAGVAKAASHAR